MEEPTTTTTMPTAVNNTEPQIPVFTVIKNDAILKNIFVVSDNKANAVDQESIEHTLLVGRHPDCNIALTHPSISRFHLQIHTKPSSLKLSVTDLSSVHGTWLSGVKIEAGTRVELKEGDTIQLGGSSRVYRLQWVPVSRAYDSESRFLSNLDATMAEDKENESENTMSSPQVEENVISDSNLKKIDSLALEDDGNSMHEANEYVFAEKSIYSASVGIVPLFSDESSSFIVKKEIPSSPLVPEGASSLIHGEEGADSSNCEHTEAEFLSSTVERLVFETESHPLVTDNESMQLHSLSKALFEGEEYLDRNPNLMSNFASSTLVEVAEPHVETEPYKSVEEVIEEDSNQLLDEGIQTGWNLARCQSSSKRGHAGYNTREKKSDLPVNLDSALSSELQVCSSIEDSEAKAVHSMCSTEYVQRDNKSPSPISLGAKRENSFCSIRKELQEITDKQCSSENKNPHCHSSGLTKRQAQQSPPVRSEKNYCEHGIRPRRGRPAGILLARTEISQGRSLRAGTDAKDEVKLPENFENNTIYKELSSGFDVEEEEIHTPDKENMSPNTLMLRSVKKMGKLGSIKNSKQLIAISSNVNANLCHHPVECLFASPDKENLTPEKVLQEQKSADSNTSNRSAVANEKSSSRSIWSRRGKPAVIQVKTEKSQGKSFQAGTDAKNEIKLQENIEDRTISKDFSFGVNGEGEVLGTPDKENMTSSKSILKSMKKIGKAGSIKNSKILKSSSSKVNANLDPPPVECLFASPEKENQTSGKVLQERNAGKTNTSGKSALENENSISRSIWSQRGKPAGLQVKKEKSQGRSLSVGTDAINEITLLKNIEDNTILKELCSGFVVEKEVIHTPDKENMSPDTLMLRSMKKMGKLESIRNSKPLESTSSIVNVNADHHPVEYLFASPDKENRTLEKALPEQESAKNNTSSILAVKNEELTAIRRTERIPFQPIPANSAEFVTFAAAESSKSICLSETILKKNQSIEGYKQTRWIMVVDTASLLDNKSRNALQLLQGIKQTSLFLPRLVIRELDRLRQRTSFFRRTSVASSVMQWIEECMVAGNRWIHVQNSMDEARLIAPTPPASPQSMLNEDIKEFPLSSSMLTEIMSPTPEDHVLDCALHHRKMNPDAKIILISNDVTLKINAMAEGLLCETAVEFRESLVNPFSERFLWTDSSPRGLTWNCQDDVVLKKYYPSPRTKLLRKEAKGLKLILLHNSQYRRI